MGYIAEIIQTQNQYLAQQTRNERSIGLPSGQAYASYFPTWEVTAPQYQQPTAYSLAQLGYRTNEVAYACIDLWMKTISEAKIKVYDRKTDEEVEGHPFTEFMEEPCPDISQSEFWEAVEMYLKISGFLGWEKDYSNIGDVIHIWPMMPQYCSFMRGQGRLLATIRYQPYTGMPYMDIDRNKCVVFSYVDPLYFGLKPFSPTMVLADIIGIDNEMTKMVGSFLRNGAFVSGLLKTEQLIDETDASFARKQWQEAHGGANNAGGVAVLGKDLEFQSAGNTFRDMVFPEVDARSEARICMTYGVKPILISAKVGMDRSTFSNYEQARKAWYEENVMNEWRFLASRITRDLLRVFDDDPNHVARFDTTEIVALQEDRNASWTRANDAFKARSITRNESRQEMGLPPMEDEVLGEGLYTTAMEQYSLSEEDNLDEPNAGEGKSPEERVKVTGSDKVKIETEEAKKEEKAFRKFAATRQKEGKDYLIGEFEFKHVDELRRRQLLNEFGVPDANAALILEAIREAVKGNNSSDLHQVFITAAVEPAPVNPPNIHVDVNVPEAKLFPSIQVEPTPVTVQVNPENKIEVNMPKVNRTIQKVRRDKDQNIDGTVTSFEYEEEEEGK